MNLSAFAFVGQEACINPLTETDDLLICSRSAATVMAKENKTEALPSLPFPTLEHLSFGYPDDMVSVIYLYDKSVKNKSGKRIGYLEIMAIENSEAGWRTQLKVYYSLSGKVLGATAKDF